MTSSGSLSSPPTSFIGRASAVELVTRLLVDNRLVTVVGPGGCGKTRLAIEVSRRTTLVPAESVFFVDLSGLGDPGLVPGTVLRALQLREVTGADPLDTLTGHLSKQQLVMLLDNCEHLLGACAELVTAVVRDCPGVWLLATSRERLGALGEAVVDLDGLELPEPGGGGDEAWLRRSEAGRLFIDRARLARAGFQLSGNDALVVATICERLDGIPLALEMAAARVRLMSVGAIAEGLSDRFRLLLTGSGRAGPPRQRSLLASIEWSCGLLTESERALLHRLSVFASGFTFRAAEGVCGGYEIERDDVFGLLASLVEKSLVQASPGPDRLRLHETMNAYAAAALEAEGGTSAVRDRHLDYFAELAHLVEPKTRTSESPSARRELEPELDNLRAAVAWSVESKQYATGGRLLSSLSTFLYDLGLSSEAVAQCAPFLAAELEPSLRAELLFMASRFWRFKDPATSLSLASELVSLGRSLRDPGAEARGLVRLAAVKMDSDPAVALEAGSKGTELAREGGDQMTVVFGLWTKGLALLHLGRPSEALTVGEEALQVADDCDWPTGRGNARVVIGTAAMSTGLLRRALEEAERLVRSGSDPVNMAAGEKLRAEVLALQGREGAIEALNRAVSLLSATGGTWEALNDLSRGWIWVSQGREDDGYRVAEAATAKLESWGLVALCLENRARLAELAVRRGDLVAARRHLASASWRLPRVIEPAGARVVLA
ncbi:MAG TPA: hypothetical protein VEJ84_18955, partial [Acidimicrobiales bacterium]|nr:hypothetical protein [Acidimicrobiales bacterium]